MKINKTYKISATIHNMAGKIGKATLLMACAAGAIQIGAALIMDKTYKTPKSRK